MGRLTFWFEFASTYSYPAAMRIDELGAAADVEIVWRPFLLGPIFKAQGWPDSPFNLYPAKGEYMWRDLARICDAQLLSFQRPDPFPQNSLLAARIATYGMEQGWGRAFSKAVYKAQFGAGKCIDDEGLLKGLVSDAGADPSEALQDAASQEVKDVLRQSTNEAQTLGIFGAPSFVTESGELFWGNDRLEQALRWAKGR